MVAYLWVVYIHYMESPTEPNGEQSGACVLLCTFESTNAGFSSFPVIKTSVPRVTIVPLPHFLINENLHHVDSTEND